jgi:transposase InsO family protein
MLARHLRRRRVRAQALRHDLLLLVGHRELDDPAIADRFAEWRRFYNADRPHSSLGGRISSERLQQLRHKVTSIGVIRAAYDPKQEWDRPQ